jgi:serine/threonine-protein kinase
MATMFGRFEIQSELSKSETASIYKALDTQTSQVVALKTLSLKPLGDRADEFVDTLLREGESTRDLVGQNIVVLYGAGEIDNQFCAAMEYIQGNSIATMLARKEGFSIWDLLDITRQVCAGLEQATAKGVTHCSLEPAKIMVQWDGMVKILGYGISNMSLVEAESGNGLGKLMPYCSPEQIRGETMDMRSNLFTLGTILYEMVVGQPAFESDDPVTLLGKIGNEMPAIPSAVNPKIQPAVSALIMKALAKDPAERYQSARELLDALEECKETGEKAAPDTKKIAAAANPGVSRADRAAAASKFVSTGLSPAKPLPAAASGGNSGYSSVATSAKVASLGDPAASRASSPVAAASVLTPDSRSKTETYAGPYSMGDFEVKAPEIHSAKDLVLSSAVGVAEAEPPAPHVAFDPMMSKQATSQSSTSFSDLAEMPPLKETVFALPVPALPEPLPPEPQKHSQKKEDKPRIQPREVAEKAFHHMATIPPRLLIYSILGAVGLILVIAFATFVHVRSEDDGSTAAPQSIKATKENSSQPTVATPSAQQKASAALAPIDEPNPNLKLRQVEKHSKAARRAPVVTPAPVAAVVTGEALIDSSPQGAQFQVDGKSDPAWVTPFNLSDLSLGRHIISVNKTGYSSDIRSVEAVAGSKASLLVHLSPVNALVAVSSTPPGANIVIDGKPVGRVTPSQFAMEKGSHTILLRKQGYLDETVTTELSVAQNFQYAPVLRALGNTEDMRTVGKLGRLFGHATENAASMGSITIHTQPKGAQVAVNQQVLDKISPVGVMVGPGNYIVDITLTGFKPVHKVLNVIKGSKAVIDETLERQ